MILLYTLSLIALGMGARLLAWRARALEHRFGRASLAVLRLAEAPPRPGNQQADICAAARRTYELGRLVQKRDALLTRWVSRQKRADTVSEWLLALRSWKGRKLPYSFGVVDIWIVLSLIDQAGLSQVLGPRAMLEQILSLLG